MTDKSTIPDLLNQLPQKPGVYQFLDANGEILYIGKAKNLKKRVLTYFTAPETRNFKQAVLVKKISDIKYVLVENESEALLLENNLIKEYKPKYNILLKDDKTFPWICIRKERFPRVMSTRNYITDGSEYFGPYTSGLMVKTLLDLIRQLYKLRTCKLNLSEAAIAKARFKRCLEFHLGNCKAPCEGMQLVEEYDQSIGQIRDILKGNFHQVIAHLREKMNSYADQLMFEEAEVIRHKITLLERFKGKSTIVNPRIKHVDVVSMLDEENFAYINFLKVVSGSIVQAHNVEIHKVLQEDKGELLGYILFELRERFKSTAPEIIVPFLPGISLSGVVFTVPVRGDKRKLLDLSARNAASYRNDKAALRVKDKWSDMELTVMTTLQHDLRLKKIPMHIECFDNSNLQGTDPVASCVVFRSTRPSKSDYRRFNIKHVDGPNDYASMEEVIERRYKRLKESGEALPDLIIVDGGKGQLNAAVNKLRQLQVYDQVAVLGIAKRLEEIYLPDDPVPLYLDKNSASLKLIQRIRDEAHRFGLSFHRKKRSSSQLRHSYSNIPGIGERTADKMLREIPETAVIKNMSVDELAKIVGKRAANILKSYFAIN